MFCVKNLTKIVRGKWVKRCIAEMRKKFVKHSFLKWRHSAPGCLVCQLTVSKLSTAVDICICAGVCTAQQGVDGATRTT